MNYLSQIIVKRCNVEPPILLGCSLPEIYATTLISFVCMIPIAVVVGLVLKMILIALPCLMFGTMLSTFLLLHKLRKLKRNRPDHYHVQWLKVKMDQLLNQGNFIQRVGFWGLRSRIQERFRDCYQDDTQSLDQKNSVRIV